MPLTINAFLFVVLLLAELLYIRVARHWGLVDNPNERSLHADTTTVRGGGVIFWLAVLCVLVYHKFTLPLFFIGLTLVAAISLLDDIRAVPKRYRLIVQAIGWSLALVQLNGLSSQWGLLVVLLLAGLGLLNGYNFMDGINGMTAFYSLVTVGTLWYWFTQLPFIIPENRLVTGTVLLFPAVFIALLVFTYFNARKQAVCFAGDVGSMSMGFIVGYGLLCLIWTTHSFLPLMLLTVFGLDTGLTIGQRLWQKQNIFQPHRQHLFQVLVQKAEWSHLQVAGLFAAVQLGINVLILWALHWQSQTQWWLCGAILVVMILVYSLMKRRFVALNVKK